MRRLAARGDYLVLLCISYVPLVLASPGDVVADTKAYLYLDPTRLLRRAVSVWDPGTGLGTVTHQTIGYLWPMGPFYWAFDAAGVPDWLAQRFWLGSILFAAGTGMLFLLRTFGMGRGPALAGALPYLLTPYVVGYAGRISAILLPFAGLPWLVGIVVRGLRRGGWRHAAVFALVVTTIGSINATALLFAGVGAIAWVPFAVWSRREVSLRGASTVLVRFALLTLVCQVWWLVALYLGGAYGSSVLEATETVEAVSATSLSSEVLRGLGNWFFYGDDRLGPWIGSSVPFQSNPIVLAAGFALPVAAWLAAAFLRWSLRSYAVVLVALGTAIAVGAYPYDSPPPLGRGLKTFTEASSFGLALRNSPRAVPLVVLGTGVLLAGAVAALERRSRAAGRAALALVMVVAFVGLPVLWNGSLVDPNLKRGDDIPTYWQAAARWLDEHDDGSRVLEIPGQDFASYRWGTTVDPITPGLIDRAHVSKELVPSGSPRAVDMVSAVDRRLQEGIFEADSLAPMARLMGVGDVLLRSDLQYERYRTPRPRTTWQQFNPPPQGLGTPVGFGQPGPNRPVGKLPLEDEIALAVPASAPDPPPVAVFGVEGRVPVVRAKPVGRSLIVAGDAEGLVDLAAAGILRGDELVRFSGEFVEGSRTDRSSVDAPEIGREMSEGGAIVVTDSNRRRARRWSTVRETYGFTEPSGFVPLADDPADGRSPPFATAGDAARTVAQYRGIAGVTATDYGNIVSYTPEDRPYNAVDADPDTAWRVGAFTDPTGETWRLDLAQPVEADRVTLVQPTTGPRDRFLTAVSLRLDGGPWRSFRLDAESRTFEGQELSFPMRSVRRVEVRLDETNVGKRARYDGVSSVGLAELRVADVRAEEVLRLPTDLLSRADVIDGRPLWISLTRNRADPAVPVRSDEEPVMARTFPLPSPRHFGIEASVRLSARSPDERLDQILGLPGPEEGGYLARSSGRLPGAVQARASAALDNDPATAWSPGFLEQRGHWIEVTLGNPAAVDRLDLQLIADGKHSTPRRLRISNEIGEIREVEIPPVRSDAVGGVVARPVTFPLIEARVLRVTITEVDEHRTQDYYSPSRIVAPIGIAELGLAGTPAVEPPTELPSGCHRGLITIDGAPIDVRLLGSRSDAEARRPLRAMPCDDNRKSLWLAAGDHEVRGGEGDGTGLDVDRIVLASTAGGEPQAERVRGGQLDNVALPKLAAENTSRSSLRVRATNVSEPFWLVLGQSRNAGWQARVDGRSIGPSELVDGFANGWLVEPGGGSILTIDLTWNPQRAVHLGLATSLAGALLCVGLAAGSFWRVRRRSTLNAVSVDAPGGDEPELGLVQGLGEVGGRLFIRLGVIAAVALLVVPVADALFVTVVGLAVAITPAGLRGRARTAMCLLATACVAAAGAYTTVQQIRYQYPTGFQWPREFALAHRLAWLGVLLLFGEVLTGAREPATTAVQSPMGCDRGHSARDRRKGDPSNSREMRL